MTVTVTPVLTGADPDELDRIAGALRAVADDLDGHADAVTATVRSVAWVGGVASRFGADWANGHRPRITSTAGYVRDAAAGLARHAAEQRHAGGINGGRAGWADADRVDRLVHVLGLSRDQIETVGDLGERLADHGATGRLIDLMTDEAFATFLAGADLVLDAGAVVVDAVTDFAAHGHLSFDERIVHALSDTAVRLGLDQGMEFAAEWLAGAATATLAPGFGAILAPFVAEIAGAIAGEIMDLTIDLVDGTTDVVDLVADAAVAAYRDITAALGVVAEIADAALAAVDAGLDVSVDFAADLAGLLFGD